jgi:hypothetical protein
MTDDYLITVEDTAHEGQQLRMVACPLPGCEATQGEDYAKYARHLAAEHGPEDVGLSASSPRLATDGGQCAGGTERIRLGSAVTCDCGWRGFQADMEIGDGYECPDCGSRLLGRGDTLHG